MTSTAMQDLRFDAPEYRQVLGRFVTGVTVVTAILDDQVHGMTANAFTSVSLDPPLILVSVDNRARMCAFLEQAGRFGVSILGAHQEDVALHFAGQPRLSSDALFVERLGLPVIDDALAHLVCRLDAAHRAGDHTLFIGEVEDVALSSHDPLVFYSGATGSFRGVDLRALDEGFSW
jgi:flavin reductase (DIM6/NTAB) family NADH-FMN oxidoreductase RutF